MGKIIGLRVISKTSSRIHKGLDGSTAEHQLFTIGIARSFDGVQITLPILI
jgi:hypothetical protein